jgi:hypothetical protein
MDIVFVLLAEICYGVDTAGTYKRVCMIGGGIKKASVHMMDLVTNKWYAEDGTE